jgi:putative restriction endonuclease
VANTDHDWFDFLAAQSEIDEVNFWQPSGTANFGAIRPGELFLFRLKSPRNAIRGYGVFSRSATHPISLAWEAFGIKNGTRNLQEMRLRVSKYRQQPQNLQQDYMIGCRDTVSPRSSGRGLVRGHFEYRSRMHMGGHARFLQEKFCRL